MTSFSQLGLKKEITTALYDLGYENPTHIQQISIPQLLCSSQDLKAFAQTGTGKTAAFSLPILQRINLEKKSIQAIILSPTRELSVQISDNIKLFSKNLKDIKTTSIYGGASVDQQVKELKKGAHIIVGTPGRTLDLIRRKVINLKNIDWLVLDEADEMLNMGFRDELDRILDNTSKDKQTLLFSATFPLEVHEIAKNYMSNPIELSAGVVNTGTDNVIHQYYKVLERNRYLALKKIVDMNPEMYGIIFCRTRKETKDIADQLINDRCSADALHGDLSQAQRDIVMNKFRNKNIKLLVATDVAARGLDVTNLTHIINYKLPDQIEAYTHRSGRTGRAGNKGVSIVIISPREVGKLRPIERKIKKKFDLKSIPTGSDICEKQMHYFIDKLFKVEIKKSELKPYREVIKEKFACLSKEEIIEKFISLELNTLLGYYENDIDLNSVEKKSKHQDYNIERKRIDKGNMTRYFINLGKKDNLTPTKLISLINEKKSIRNLDIGQIDILNNFSFFELEKSNEDQIILALKNVSFNGREVNVEITRREKDKNLERRFRRNYTKSIKNNNFKEKRKRSIRKGIKGKF